MKYPDPNSYYDDEEILKALVFQCRNRELWLKCGDDIKSDRPLKADSIEELKKYIHSVRGQAIINIYASVEVFSNPLLLNSNPPDELRIGWDLFLDFDSIQNIEYAKRCAISVFELLKTFNVEHLKVKFSGDRGFHFIIPGSAFDCFVGGSREYVQAFPSVPMQVARFLTACLKSDQRKGVKIDLDVYKPRQMMRLAYSLHQKTGLVSLPLHPDEVRGFRLEDAEVERLRRIDWEWLRLEADVGEANKLLKAVAEWVEGQKVEPGIKILKPGPSPKGKAAYGWIERLLTNPVDDGRHRLLWLVIAPYLVNVQRVGREFAKKRAVEYLKACGEVRALDGSLLKLVDYYIEYSERKGLKPPSLRTLRLNYPDLYDIIKKALPYEGRKM